ncbi:MAG: O-antigen polymerase [Ginsengibacter sp.]
MNDLNNILLELVFILLHFFLFIFNYTISKKKLFSPAALFSLVWVVILVLHFIFRFTILNQLFPLHLETYLVLFLGTVSFSIGSLLVASYFEKGNSQHNIQLPFKNDVFETSLLLRVIFLAIIIIGLPFYIQAAYRVFLASNIDNFFVGLRIELSYGDEDIGITKYLTSLSFVVFAINYYVLLRQKNKLNTWLVVISFIAALVYSIFATGRTYFFMILSIYLGINYLLNKKLLLKKYLWPLLIFILLFMSIGIIYNKGGNTEDTLIENLHSSSETTAVYLVSSLNAFDLELSKNVKAQYPGENTLLFFVKVLQRFEFLPNTKTGSLVSEFVFVPYPTNVYTFYSPYIRDFGKIYAWFMIFLFGALHTWLFYKALETKKLRYTLYYSFLLYPLFMSFFQDQYLSLLSTWLQFIFYIEVFIFINHLLIKSNKSKPTYTSQHEKAL